jgi:hypothetical protein
LRKKLDPKFLTTVNAWNIAQCFLTSSKDLEMKVPKPVQSSSLALFVVALSLPLSSNAGSWEKAGKETSEAASAVGDAAEDSAKAAWDATEEGSRKAWEATKETAEEGWDATKKGANELYEDAKKTVE